MSQIYKNSSSSNVTPFEPNVIVQGYDDFVSEGGNSPSSNYAWINRNNDSSSPINGTATNPGIWNILVSTPGQSWGFGLRQNPDPYDQSPFTLGAGTFNSNLVIQLQTLSNGTDRYTAKIGWIDAFSYNNPSPTDPVDGIYFQYSDNVNSGKWQIVCINSSVATVTNTSVSATTSFVNLGIQVNAAGTSVKFTIGGVTVGTITTHIPSNPFSVGMVFLNSSGVTSGCNVDLWYYTQTLTTAR